MKQRLKLAQALVHDPELLLLDEPTNGLDPKGRRHMLELVHDLGHAQGKHILLCSHLLPDVEKTCETVVVIHRGRIHTSGTIAELTRHEGSWVRARVEGDSGAFAASVGAAGLDLEAEGPGSFRIRLPGEDGDQLFALAERSGAVVSELTLLRSTLEEVFVETLAEVDRDVERNGGAG
jgi:ABC-2 type transport system ATP-binding protein